MERRKALVASGTVSVTTVAQDVSLNGNTCEVQIKNLAAVAGHASPKSVLGAATATNGTKIIGVEGYTEIIPVGYGETLSVIADAAVTWEINQYG